MVNIPLVCREDHTMNLCHLYSIVFITLGIVYISFGLYEVNTIEIICGFLSLLTSVVILICQNCCVCEIENEVGDSILENAV